MSCNVGRVRAFAFLCGYFRQVPEARGLIADQIVSAAISPLDALRTVPRAGGADALVLLFIDFPGL
jgi:hypothetical protein